MTRSRFIIIGENLHASRILRRGGKLVGPGPDGRESLAFRGPDGRARSLAIPEAVRHSKDSEKGRIKHVQAAILAGMRGTDADSAEGIGYLQLMAVRQEEAGAAWLDLNVDEISADDAERQQVMRWLVGVVEEVATVPLVIDSSSADVLRAGAEAARGIAGRPMVNSASIARPEVLDLVASSASPVILSAAGLGAIPEDAEERLVNAAGMIELARARGIARGAMFIDPLVLPATARAEGTLAVLGAVRALRERFGSEIHITGGLSNVSFGLPARRVINEVFIDLFVEAGGDSGIIDPIGSRPRLDRTSRPWRLATELLLAVDPYGRAYLKAHAAGELADG